MKTTTIRFGDDLWALLESEAAASGVSVSQYVREAALSRAAFSAGARAEAPAELLARWAQSAVGEAAAYRDPARDADLLIAALTRTKARAARAEAEAVHRESEQTQRRSRSLQDD